MNQCRYLVVGFVSLLALAACNGDDDTASTSSAAPIVTPPSTTASPPTTAPPSTTAPTTTAGPVDTSGSTEPPPESSAPTTTAEIGTPVDDGTDWTPIVQEVYDRRFALFETPDPALVDTVTIPGSSAHTDLMSEVENLVSKGLHVEGSVPGRIVSAEPVSIYFSPDDPTVPTGVRLTITLTPTLAGGRLVDASGATVEEINVGYGSNRVSVNMARFSAGEPWRIDNELYLAADGAG